MHNILAQHETMRVFQVMASQGATFFFDRDADFVSGYTSTLRAEFIFGQVADNTGDSEEESKKLYTRLVKSVQLTIGLKHLTPSRTMISALTASVEQCVVFESAAQEQPFVHVASREARWACCSPDPTRTQEHAVEARVAMYVCTDE
jgi:hypothetical protein